MMPTRNTDNIEHHQEYNPPNNPPTSPYHTYNRNNSRVFGGTMNQAPTAIYYPPQSAFQQSDLSGSHDPRRYGIHVAPTNAMQGGLMQFDPTHHMGGMITNAPPQYPMAYRGAPEHPSFPNNTAATGSIYVTADGQRISQMGPGGMPMATAPHYAYTGGMEMAQDAPIMPQQQLPPSNSSSTANNNVTQGSSFPSQSEREEELLLQLLIARRNRTQQTGVVANDSLADELMRLRQSRGGFQASGFPVVGTATTMNQSVMDSSLVVGGSMQRQFLPDLNGRIDRNPTRLVDARTQDSMMDLSQRGGVGKRSGLLDGKFGQLDHSNMYMGGHEEEDNVAPLKKQKRAHRKKPADMPRRPLSAYNLFFSEERERILKEIELKEEGKEEVADTDPTVVEKKASEDQSEAAADDKKSETNEDADNEDGATTGKPKAFLRPLVATEKKRRPHRKTHGKISFQTLARMVGERWKGLSEEHRKYYQDLAEEDAKRQRVAMDAYYAKQGTTSTRKKGSDEDTVDKPQEEVEEEEGGDDAKGKESPLSNDVSAEKDVV